MSESKFQGLSNEELADVWYALGGAEIRHPGGFSRLVDATFAELNRRLPTDIGPFLDERYRDYRLADSKQDAEANAMPAVGAHAVQDTYPA